MEHDANIIDNLYKCIIRLRKDPLKQEKVIGEVSLYINSQGLFENELAIRIVKTRPPS